MTPNWFINIASPILNIPLHLFFISVFIGKLESNIVTNSVESQFSLFSFSLPSRDLKNISRNDYILS